MSNLEDKLVSDCVSGISLIKSSGVHYIEFGIFGSFARNEVNINSDVDFVIIVDEIPDRNKLGLLRDKLETVNCDLLVLLKETFNNPDSLISKNVKRDYKRISYYEE